MKKIQEAIGKELIWFYKSGGILRLEYELRSDSDVYASFCWHKNKIFSRSQTEAESRDGKWIIQKKGIFYPLLKIYPLHSDSELATVKISPWKVNYTIQLASGKRFQWLHENIWSLNWVMIDENCDLIFRVRNFCWRWKKQEQVQLKPPAISIAELPLLIILSRYFMKRYNDAIVVGGARGIGGV